MKILLTTIHAGLEKITEAHPEITDPKKRLEAKTVSFMALVMILGVSLNLMFGSGLTPITLFVLILGYGFSRSRRFTLASYLIIGVLLFAIIRSLIIMGDFDSHAILTNVAWLTLSLVFAESAVIHQRNSSDRCCPTHHTVPVNGFCSRN